MSRYGFFKKCILFRITCNSSKFDHTFQIENIFSILKDIQPSSFGMVFSLHTFSCLLSPKFPPIFFFLFTSLCRFLDNFLRDILSLTKSLLLFNLLFNPSIEYTYFNNNTFYSQNSIRFLHIIGHFLCIQSCYLSFPLPSFLNSLRLLFLDLIYKFS